MDLDRPKVNERKNLERETLDANRDQGQEPNEMSREDKIEMVWSLERREDEFTS